MPLGRQASLGVSALIVTIGVAGCNSRAPASTDGGPTSTNNVTAATTPSSQSTISSWPASSGDTAAPKPGMVWVPAGLLKAGTPASHTPRIPDEEMPATPIEMGGFYIDLLPWPNEPNAIPTSNVSRDDAEGLCASKGKRLCTELEWERACKGPENAIYEYGDAYRKDVCGTGVALEQASRRPTGEHAQCKSGFGVSEMHGGVWEWTSSAWGRGSTSGASQGVLRGGNSVAGELVGRCANAIARSPSKKAPTMGFRCCAGPKNTAEVKLELQGTPGVAMKNMRAEALAAFVPAIATAAGSDPSIDPKSLRAWSWTPVPNEELVLAMGCGTASPRACGLVVGRSTSSADAGANAPILTSVSTGRELPEITKGSDARHIRVRSLDVRGIFSREVTYVYGRVDVGDMKRP